MKIFNNTRVVIGFALLTGLFVASCTYDESDQIGGQGPNFIRVDAGPDKLAVAPTVTSTVTIANVLRDANSSGSLAESVSVSFSTDASIVSAYNAENGTEYVALDPSLFSFESSSLTFDGGVFTAPLVITLKATGLDLSKDYAIGLKLSASGWTAAGDSFIKLALPSQYEGNYASSGTRYNYNSAGEANVATWPPTGWVSSSPWSFDTQASTLSSKTIAVQAANSNGGFGRMNLTVSADNSVTIEANSDIGLANFVQSTHRPSTYDPATKTFELYYEYTNTTGTFRNLYHKLVKK